jgi:hypothetical protein
VQHGAPIWHNGKPGFGRCGTGDWMRRGIWEKRAPALPANNAIRSKTRMARLHAALDEAGIDRKLFHAMRSGESMDVPT